MKSHVLSPNRRRRSQATGAFTLIELIIAIALLMIVMLMVMSMFRSAQDLYRIASQRSDVFSQGRTALDVIEADLQKIAGTRDGGYGDLIMCSATVEDESLAGADNNQNAVVNIQAYGEAGQKIQQDIEDKPPNNDLTKKIRPILTFKTSTSWFDSEGHRQSGLAQVTYYIKKKPVRKANDEKDDVQPLTGYLVRYIVPLATDYGVLAEERRMVEGEQEEIAASVLDVKVYAFNNAAAAYMGQQHRKYELFPRLDKYPTPSAKTLRDGSEGQQPVTNQIAPVVGVLDELQPRANETYTFGRQRGGRPEYLKSRGNYPLAIAIEITFANDQIATGLKGSVLAKEVNGTLRVVRRVISIPNTEAMSSLEKMDIERIDQTR